MSSTASGDAVEELGGGSFTSNGGGAVEQRLERLERQQAADTQALTAQLASIQRSIGGLERRLEDGGTSRQLDAVLRALEGLRAGCSTPTDDGRLAATATVLTAPSSPTKSTARTAQERLEKFIQTCFASFDVDGSGILDPEEVKQALNSLGTLPGGRAANDDDVAQIMHQYDADNSGGLDADEFKKFVRDLALQGKLKLGDEDMQTAVEQIVVASKEDPWANVLRGDSGVRHLLETLRIHGRNERFARRGLLRRRNSISSATHERESAPDAAAKIAIAARPADYLEAVDGSVHGPAGGLVVHPPPRRASALAGLGQCGRVLCGCCTLIPVMHPEGSFRSVWNIAMALLIIYCGVVVPLEIAFERSMKLGMGDAGWQAWEGWNLFVDILFVRPSPPTPPSPTHPQQISRAYA